MDGAVELVAPNKLTPAVVVAGDDVAGCDFEGVADEKLKAGFDAVAVEVDEAGALLPDVDVFAALSPLKRPDPLAGAVLLELNKPLEAPVAALPPPKRPPA